MKDLLSQRSFIENMNYAYLCNIWHVDADSTYYSIKNKGVNISEFVAVRTINGYGTLTEFNQQIHHLTPNTFGLFNSSDISHCKAGEDGWEFFWFRFNYSQWKDLQNSVYQLYISSNEQKLMERCFIYLNLENPEGCMIAESLFNYLLLDWIHQLHMDGKEALSLVEIEALLEKWDSQKLDLSEIAQEAGMSERTFRNTVQRVCGLSPKKYITKIKMHTAMDLLQDTYMSVSEVSDFLKFDNPLYFSRVFKNFYGVSPKNAINMRRK